MRLNKLTSGCATAGNRSLPILLDCAAIATQSLPIFPRVVPLVVVVGPAFSSSPLALCLFEQRLFSYILVYSLFLPRPFCECHLSCPLQAPLESELVKGYEVEGNLIYEERQLQQASAGAAGLARRGPLGFWLVMAI